MSTFKHFREIEAWQYAQKQSLAVFSLTNDFPFTKDFSLKNQINRSSGSVMDNIAEGFGRGGNKEFIQFLGYARGSNMEVESQIQRALDRKYISENIYDRLIKENKRVGVKISNLIRYLQSCEYTGTKYRCK